MIEYMRGMIRGKERLEGESPYLVIFFLGRRDESSSSVFPCKFIQGVLVDWRLIRVGSFVDPLPDGGRVSERRWRHYWLWYYLPRCDRPDFAGRNHYGKRRLYERRKDLE